MKTKSLYELGKLAQQGNELAMLEIIDRKKKMLKWYSSSDEDLYQFLVIRLLEGIKNFKF